MFCELNISNFKCFPEETIAFKNLTFLAGSNASGKSSIIQALLLIEETTRLREDECRILQNLSRILGVQTGGPQALVAQNPQGKSEYDFEFKLDGKKFCYTIDKNTVLNLKVEAADKLPKHEMTYLNAERIGPRMLYEAGGIEKITSNGSNAVYLIEQGDKNGLKVADALLCEGTSSKFSHQVEGWMQAILGELQFQVHIDNLKAQSELLIGNSLAQAPVIPTLTGFGISYVLPIVVAALWCSAGKNHILIIENPEAHLHPAAQSAMGQFLALTAHAGVQVIVETHSEHIVDGARIEMMQLENTEQMLVNFLKNDEEKVYVNPLLVNEKGELDEWPEGFFDQKQIDLRKIFQMRMANGNSK